MRVDQAPEGEAAQQSFSELTVELIEQAAALAGERVSAPIRAAGATAARLLIVAACLAGLATVGLTFLGVSIGLLVGQAPEPYRWWVCLLVAVPFFVAAAIVGMTVFRGKARKAE